MPFFQKILAATDLSACAGTAVTFASEIARHSNGQLTVLYVEAGLPEYTSRVLAGEQTHRSAANQLRSAAQTELREHVSSHVGGRSRVMRVVETGRAATEIATVSNRMAADLIVIGTRGHGPLTRALIGSVAEEVITVSTRPVLSIRCRKPPLAPEFRRIVCAVNYTDTSRNAFAAAIAFASTFDAKLIAVHVVEQSGGNAKEESGRLSEWVRNETLAVETQVLVRRRSAASALIDFVRRNDVDLLVVGAKRTLVAKKTTLGSTTGAVTHRARCPVLTVSA